MPTHTRFFGWSVAWAAFTLAVFAWGVGFYGPSVFLHTLTAAHGWSIALVSTAISVHFLASAFVIAYLPEIHRRFGIARTTFAGALLSAAGLLAWSGLWAPWQLFAAALLSAAGWALTSGAALNAIVARWFERERPQAISLAFNGASVGGVIFIPLWVTLIDSFGFRMAAIMVGGVMVAVVAGLAFRYFAPTPDARGLTLDGLIPDAIPPDTMPTTRPPANPMSATSRAMLLRDPRFMTISAGFALGLFAQIGLLAHLLVRLAPDLGTPLASAFVSLAAISAIIGRTLLGWCLGARDRRLAAGVNFAVQIVGVVLLAFGTDWMVLGLGCVLFGLGVGNQISLPPLIAQQEFARADVITVVALVVAINQAVFAFAPAIVGALRDATSDYAAPFLVIALVQVLAAAIVLSGRGARAPITPTQH